MPYQGPTAVAKVLPHLSVEIVKRSDHASGFCAADALGCRACPLAAICRRLAKDFENLSRIIAQRTSNVKSTNAAKALQSSLNFSDGLLEAAGGMLLFGISTAFIFTVMQYYFRDLRLMGD